MLEKIEVYQQPAGFVDNVIFSWITKHQAETTTASLEQRDLFASPLSENGKAVAFLSHQIQTFIAGKMSAALQLTDTHFSFMIKACSRRSKEQIKREMRTQASRDEEDKPIGFRCGPYEVLRISYECHQYMEEQNEKKNTVLAGMRQNYMLSYRPNLRTGKMERCDTQEWCQAEELVKEGSHRIKASWAQDRYSWLDENMRPKQPEWQRCGPGIETHEDMEDSTAHGEPGCKIQLKSWEKDEELKSGVEEPCVIIDEVVEDVLGGATSAEFLQSVKERRLRQNVDKLLTQQGTKHQDAEYKLKQQKKKAERSKMREAVRIASEVWRQEQGELLKKFSRKQLLSIFIPSAGKKLKAQAKTQAEQSLEKSAKDVIKAKMKTQMKMIKAKLAKNGSLKLGLSMAVGEEQISFEATPQKKAIENAKACERVKAIREKKKLEKQAAEEENCEGEEKGEEQKPGEVAIKKEVEEQCDDM